MDIYDIKAIEIPIIELTNKGRTIIRGGAGSFSKTNDPLMRKK